MLLMHTATEPFEFDWTAIEVWREPVLRCAFEMFMPTRDLTWVKSLPSPSTCWDDGRRLNAIMEEMAMSVATVAPTSG
jgi:hypothetical protein